MTKWRSYLIILQFLFSATLCVTNLRAQDRAQLNIVIKLDDSTYAKYASIAIKNIKDTIKPNYVISETGIQQYSNLTVGDSYEIYVKYLGYKNIIVKTMLDGLINNREILLNPANNIEIKEVIIEGKHQLIERMGAKLLVDAAGLRKYTNDATLLGLLNITPGVIVNDNKITLNGRSDTKVLVDGKPQLSGNPVQLMSVPAENIKTIEIIENPSAQFDASGSGGIINIVTKKVFAKQFNSTLSALMSQGKVFSYSVNNNLVYSNEKLLINNDLTFTRNRNLSDRHYLQSITYNNALNTNLNEHGTTEMTSAYPSGSLSLDYKLDKIHLLSAGASVFSSDFISDDNNLQSLVTGSQAPVLIDFSGMTEDEGLNLYGFIGITSNVDPNGSTRKIFADYTHYSMNTAIKNSTHQNGLTEDLINGNVDSKVGIFTTNVDYYNLLKSNASISYGLRYAYSTMNSNSAYFVKGMFDNDLSQNTGYIEHIGALYFEYTKNFKNVNFNLGLRGEYTNLDNNFVQDIQESEVKRTYFNLFPSFNINFIKNKGAIFTLFGGRRITRPPYTYFSPYRKILNNYSYFQGNPNISPIITYNLGTSFVFKQAYTASLSYSYVDRAVGSLSSYDPSSSKTIYTLGNINSQQIVALSMFAPFDITKKLSFTSSVNINYNKYATPETIANYKNDGAVSLTSRISAAYTLTDHLSFNSTFFYFSGSTAIQSRVFDLSYLNVGANYSLLKSKLNIKMTVKDIFLNNNRSEETRLLNSTIWSNSILDTRNVQINLIYDFGGLKGYRRTKKPNNEDRGRLN